MSDKSILLVDDDDDDCFLFQDALNEVNSNAELKTTNSCDQLMNMLSKQGADLPDLIVMDMNMPKQNGAECLSCLKVARKLKHIPVVILSTSNQRESMEMVFDKGAAQYFTKPDTFAALKKIVGQLLDY